MLSSEINKITEAIKRLASEPEYEGEVRKQLLTEIATKEQELDLLKKALKKLPVPTFNTAVQWVEPA